MKRSLILLLLTSALLSACNDQGAVSDVNQQHLEQLMAAADYDQLVAELSKGDPSTSLAAHEWLLLAQARLGQGEVPKAERALRDGLEAFPGDVKLSLLLSQLYQSLGQVSRALGALEAVTGDLDSVDFQLELGVIKGRLNDLEGARIAFGKARDLGADSADVDFNLGVLVAASGDYVGAAKHFEAALAAAPERSHVKREWASSLFRQAPTDPERAKLVANLLDEVLEAAPEDWRAWSLLGETQLTLGDPEAARVYLTKALEFSHNEASVEALYIKAAKAANSELEALGIKAPKAAPKRGAPPIPVSVKERIKAAQRENAEREAEQKQP